MTKSNQMNVCHDQMQSKVISSPIVSTNDMHTDTSFSSLIRLFDTIEEEEKKKTRIVLDRRHILLLYVHGIYNLARGLL